MGIALRTGNTLSLNLAPMVWKQLAGIPLTPADLSEVDRDYVLGESIFSPISQREIAFFGLSLNIFFLSQVCCVFETWIRTKRCSRCSRCLSRHRQPRAPKCPCPPNTS